MYTTYSNNVTFNNRKYLMVFDTPNQKPRLLKQGAVGPQCLTINKDMDYYD